MYYKLSKFKEKNDELDKKSNLHLLKIKRMEWLIDKQYDREIESLKLKIKYSLFKACIINTSDIYLLNIWLIRDFGMVY